MRKAFAIMQGWDHEAGIEPRSPREYELDVPGSLSLWTWDEWLDALEADDVAAIVEGRMTWGLPIIG